MPDIKEKILRLKQYLNEYQLKKAEPPSDQSAPAKEPEEGKDGEPEDELAFLEDEEFLKQLEQLPKASDKLLFAAQILGEQIGEDKVDKDKVAEIADRLKELGVIDTRDALQGEEGQAGGSEQGQDGSPNGEPPEASGGVPSEGAQPPQGQSEDGASAAPEGQGQPGQEGGPGEGELPKPSDILASQVEALATQMIGVSRYLAEIDKKG